MTDIESWADTMMTCTLIMVTAVLADFIAGIWNEFRRRKK